MAFRAIAHALTERLAQSLGDGPVHLSLQKFWIDHPSAVVHCHIAQDLEGTSVAVYLDHGHMGAEAERVVAQDKMHRELQPNLDVRWQLLRPLGRGSDFGKGHGVLWTCLVDHFAFPEHDVLGPAVQEMRRQEGHFLACLLEPLIHCRAPKCHAATRERALP